MYWTEDMTLQEIADLVEVNESTILSWMRKFGIERRRKSWRGLPKPLDVRVCLSEDQKIALRRFAREQKRTQSAILRDALVDHMLKKGFNPFKEN